MPRSFVIVVTAPSGKRLFIDRNNRLQDKEDEDTWRVPERRQAEDVIRFASGGTMRLKYSIEERHLAPNLRELEELI